MEGKEMRVTTVCLVAILIFITSVGVPSFAQDPDYYIKKDAWQMKNIWKTE